MKQRIIFTLQLVIFSTTILFFGCTKNNESLTLNPDGTVKTSGTIPINYTARISIEASGYNPATVTVMQGGSILWVNNDAEQAHTVTADDGSFDSGDIQPGGTFSYTFNNIGPHYYHCKYHKEMSGVVKCVTK